MSKENWLKAYERLEYELDREPTGEEVDERCADIEAALIDRAMDLYDEKP